MSDSKEILALFNLIDDPDEEVFYSVQQRIISYGLPIIPKLECLWENTVNEAAQERIEKIIHQLQLKQLTDEFVSWKEGDADLLFGSLLVSKYQFPTMVAANSFQEIEKIRRNIWIEMNSYLTPLEQIKVIESILYNYYKMRGGEIVYDQVNEFAINKLLETKKGNAITAGILYLILCELLDVPVKAINIPQQFILGYFGSNSQAVSNFSLCEDIQFFIDPSTGTAYSHKDIQTYLNRISVSIDASYFKPLSNKDVIKLLLEEFAKCFDNIENIYKHRELLNLASII